ncbi:MAG: MBL fold metallo-hydrolase [Hymenobacteraceae bacterium]|nr:MBL fold metallo-hydrolase [Hymenobacteraceae bacterium]MDX5395058.1 MBL fold metallo-hydrolase [Hymenobacteraceae bacterium]MDX5443091.1 MBL fold metallo-hydrolase [Hymenobacteraceae bacterium]MDX5511094.1 MBL fold metallo-hydrolase [Hymenobacteraceae bacterium]
MNLHVIDTGYFKLDGGAMFGVVPKSLWNKINPSDENNMCSWAMRCLLIEDGDRLILIDNGIGDKQDAKFLSYYYLHGDASLQKSIHQAGFDFKDITDVFLTHLHFDHCGGSVRYGKNDKLELTFPNATYWSNNAHWQWAVHPNAREKASFLKENILPIQESGNLRFVDPELPSPIPQMDVIFVDGHTEKMMLPVIEYKGRKIIYMADLIPSAGHIPLPYIMSYDVRPLDTLNEKTEILKQAADENTILFFEHDPVIECGTVVQTEKGIRLDKTFKLNEL